MIQHLSNVRKIKYISECMMSKAYRLCIDFMNPKFHWAHKFLIHWFHIVFIMCQSSTLVFNVALVSAVLCTLSHSYFVIVLHAL
jgi:hypothetical protein